MSEWVNLSITNGWTPSTAMEFPSCLSACIIFAKTLPLSGLAVLDSSNLQTTSKIYMDFYLTSQMKTNRREPQLWPTNLSLEVACAVWHYWLLFESSIRCSLEKPHYAVTIGKMVYWVERACAYAFASYIFSILHMKWQHPQPVERTTHQRINGNAKMKGGKKDATRWKAGLTNSAKKMISFYDVIMWNKYRKKRQIVNINACWSCWF